MSRARAAALAATAAVSLLPSVVLACPVCQGRSADDQTAYLWATLVMLALPLGLLGAFVAWLRSAVARRA